jgi:homoserine O-succinyltransferase
MLTVAILNSMPDAAVRSTERQFTDLLTDAAGRDIALHVEWYSIKPRAGYGSPADLWRSHFDGLIATGTEPKAPRISDESCWHEFTKTVDWAVEHTYSAIWSCLGAHAAVLHLDNLQRRPFATKLHGVFEGFKQVNHPLLADTEPVWEIPHSRWNDLPVSDVQACGYEILILGPEAGADLFIKTFGRSLFVFIQSHPEYDSRALMREYRRDILRFLNNERPDYPEPPAHYFDLRVEQQLSEIRERNLGSNPDPALVDFQVLIGKASLEATWKQSAIQLYRNWFNLLIERRTKRLAQAVL